MFSYHTHTLHKRGRQVHGLQNYIANKKAETFSNKQQSEKTTYDC